MKKFLLLIASSILALFLVACGDADVEKVENEDEEEVDKEEVSADEKEEEEEEEEPENYEIGDTVSIDGVEITLESVTWGEEEEYVESDNGSVLRLEVKAENNSDDSAFFDDSEFSVSDDNGSMLEMYFGNDDANMFTSDIKKGKNASGVLEFDAPESEQYEVYYEPSFSFKDNAEVVWIIDSSDIE